jgi:tungstate transport system ATP-binding protein
MPPSRAVPEVLYRVRALRVDLAGRTVLDVPALDVARGQVTAIVGPNGAGKTTLLRVLAFLLRPAAGVVEFDGGAVAWQPRELAAVRRRVTLVAQFPLLFSRSVGANVAYGLRARGLPDAGRVDAALGAVGLAGFAERPASKLSGGETRRVALARALAIDPAVYLLDEPTANVDQEHVAVIEELVAGLGAAGKTVVLATHDADQAGRLGHAVLSITAGRVTPVLAEGERRPPAPR